HIRRHDLRRPALVVACEDQLLAVIESEVREREDALRLLRERIEEDPLDEAVELAVLLEDVQRVVVPAVLADQAVPALGGRWRLRHIDPAIAFVVYLQGATLWGQLRAVAEGVVGEVGVSELAYLRAQPAASGIEPDATGAFVQVEVLLATLV